MCVKMEFLQVDFNGIEEKNEYINIIRQVIKKCYEVENLEDSKLYINIILTNPANIKKINREYRNIDKETDVLSFPMFEKKDLELKIKNKSFENIDILGDIIISINQVEKQAIEYGHSFERELSYMVVHGFYHLMGYDHMEEEEKKAMRSKEEIVLKELEITR